MTAIEALDKQIKQACPNAQGVSIGRWNDKATWRVTPNTLSPLEQATAAGIFASFNPVTFVPIDFAKRKADLASANTIADLKAILQDLL